jgi:hypothetical protein
LGFGYPDTFRLIFDHGFASPAWSSAGSQGSLASAMLRGIPMGPIVDKQLAPILDGLDAKETP